MRMATGMLLQKWIKQALDAKDQHYHALVEAARTQAEELYDRTPDHLRERREGINDALEIVYTLHTALKETP